MYTIDLVVEYNEVEYRVIENLNSDMLLVIRESDFQSPVYPLQTFVIPNQLNR